MSSYLRETLEKIEETVNQALSILIEIPESCSHIGLVDDAADVLCVIKETYIPDALAKQKYEAKWELGAEYEYAYCSHCGHQQWASWDSRRDAAENIEEFHKEYKFCPNCGYEMKGSA